MLRSWNKHMHACCSVTNKAREMCNSRFVQNDFLCCHRKEIIIICMQIKYLCKITKTENHGI